MSAAGDLTPAQHAAIRRHLALLPVYIWLVYAWTLFVRGLPAVAADPNIESFRDFVNFYLLGTIANARDIHALYDMPEQVAIMARVAPTAIHTQFPPLHAPQVALMFAPLARLPYLYAMYVWLALTLGAYAVCGRLLWRACPRLRDQPWTAALLLAAAPGLHFDLSFAQTSILALVCVTAAFFALRARHPFLAGLAIGSLAYKPQLGLAAACVFVCAAEWRMVFGAAAGAMFQFAAAAVYWGPGVLRQYAGELARTSTYLPLMEPMTYLMHSWRAFFKLAGLPAAAALSATVAASLLTIAMACSCWRGPAPLAVRFSALLIATVLVNPHIYVYDLMLLTPLFLLAWNWSLEQGDARLSDVLPVLASTRAGRLAFGSVIQVALYATFLSPILGPLAEIVRVQFSVIAMSLLGVLLVMTAHGDTKNGNCRKTPT